MNKIFKVLTMLFILNIGVFASVLNETTKSVVKIFTTTSTPNYQYPWQTSKIMKYTGSGAIISQNRILTAAHVVGNLWWISICTCNKKLPI